MSFHNVQFPTTISLDSLAGPGFKTGIVEGGTGVEERTQRWSDARVRMDARRGAATMEALQTILKFYRARAGMAYSFRVKDFTDYASTASGTTHLPDDVAIDDEDQEIGVGGGSEQDFQLIKKYTDAAGTQTRVITKPVSGTVLVALDDVLKSEGSDYTINYSTGVVTFTTAPGTSVVVTAGFEFDFEGRFGELDHEALMAAARTQNMGAIPSIPIVEVKDGTLVPEEFFYGGGDVRSFGASILITHQEGRVQRLTATTTSLVVGLPTTLDYVPAGCPHFVIENAGSNTFTVKVGIAGATVATLTAGDKAEFFIGLNASSVKTWYAFGP